MNIHYGQNQDVATVLGFEVPNSPDASYNNVYTEDYEKQHPPMVPQHLHQTLLNYPESRDLHESLPLPHNGTLNHFYSENRESQQSVAVLGVTNRFHAKYVTVVLYKPVNNNGRSST